MDNITFTGINNLKIYQTRINSESKNTIRICAHLTDDANGNDFSNYLEKFSRCDEVFKDAYLNMENIQSVKMDCIRIAKNKYKFRLNESPLYFDSNEVLPLFEFLGAFTKKAQTIAQSDEQKALLGKFNQSITKEAAKYFDITI